MAKKTTLRRLEALEKLKPPGTIVPLLIWDYNKLFNLEGKDAKPENVIKYLARKEEDGTYRFIEAVIADPSEY